MFTAIVLIIIVCIAFYHYFRGRNDIFKLLKLPGPKPRFLVGNLLEVIGEKSPPLQLQEWTQEYGKVYGYMEGGFPVIVISDLDLLQEIFVKKFSSFHARKLAPSAPNPDKDKMISVFTARGARWKRLRSIANPVFTVAKLKQVVPLIDASVDEMLDILDRLPADQPVDIYPYYQRMALDVIAKVAFGFETSVQLEENNEVYRLCKTIFGILGLKSSIFTTLAAIFPEARPVITFFGRWTARLRGVPMLFLIDKLRKVVKDRKADREKKMSPKRMDFIEMMLEAEAEEGWEKENFASDTASSKTVDILRVQKKLTNLEIVSQMMVILLAGYETTSTSMAFLSYLLAMNPDVQEKLQQELDEHFADGTEVNFDSVAQLKYLDLVVKESLRLYPNASAVLTRKCMEPIQVGDYYFPKDIYVAADVWSVHRSRELWGDDADLFRPDRMEDQKSRHAMSWIPFGIGPRICLGMRLALLEEKMTISKLLLRYSFVKWPQTPETLTLKGGFTVGPADVTLVLRKRKTDS